MKNEFEQTEVKIKIILKEHLASFKRGEPLVFDPYEEHIVFANEIGTTPEHAVQNSV